MMGLNLSNLKEKLNYNQWNSVCYRYFMIIQYCWFKIIGLSPWALNTPSSRDEKNICYFSYIGTFYSILIIIIYVSTVYFNYIVYSLDSNPDSEQVLSLQLYEKLCLILSHSLILMMLIFIFRQRSLISIIHQIKLVTKKIGQCDNFKKELDCTIYLTLMTDCLIISSIMIVEICYNFSVTMIVQFILECFFEGGMIIQFVIFLNIITKHFEAINSSISDVDNVKINTAQVHPSYVINMAVSVPEPDLQIIDSDSVNAYVDLYKICDSLKKFYGLPILIDILNLSVKTLCMLYFTIWNSIRYMQEDAREIMQMVFMSLRNIFLLIVLTSNVTKTINQVILFNKIII